MIIDEMYRTIDSVFGLLLWPLTVATKSLYKNPATIFWYLLGTYLAHTTFSALNQSALYLLFTATWVITGASFGYWVANGKDKGTVSLILSVFFSGFLLYLPIKFLLDYLQPWLLS